MTIVDVHVEKGDTAMAISLLSELIRQVPAPKYEGDITQIRDIVGAVSHLLYEHQGDSLRKPQFWTCYRWYRRYQRTHGLGFDDYASKSVDEANMAIFVLFRDHLDDPEVFLWEMADPAYGYPRPAAPAPIGRYYAPPELTEFTKPVYPLQPEGLASPVVTLKILVGVGGEVLKAVVSESVNEACDEAALKAAETAGFLPAMEEGKPTEAWVGLPVRFRHPRMRGPSRLPFAARSEVIDSERYIPEPHVPLSEFVPYDTPPSIVRWVEPDYPGTVRGCIQEPIVLLRILINQEGRVEDAIVLKSLTQTCDSAALNGIKTAQFSPARFKGKPVKAWFSFPVKFRVPGPGK